MEKKEKENLKQIKTNFVNQIMAANTYSTDVYHR